MSSSNLNDGATSADSSLGPGGSFGQFAYLARALIGGLVIAVPAGWLLVYLAVMPALLGLFFFLVLGLLIGAVMCRLARGGAPFARERLTPISIIVSLVIWSTVLVLESRKFPDFAARDAIRNSLTVRMSADEVADYQERVRQTALSRLSSQYRPGGVLGYIQWAATSGRMELPRAGTSPPFELRNVQPRLVWVVRVGLSLVLLLFSVNSLLATLAPKPPVEEEEAATGGDAPSP